jgi:AraC-like DNA-binding protein
MVLFCIFWYRKATMNDHLFRLFFQDAPGPAIGRVSAGARIRNNAGADGRRLDCYALVYVIDGRGRFRQAGEEAVSLRAGDAFLLFPGIAHWYGPPAGASWNELYLLFEGPIFDLWLLHGLLDPDRAVYRLAPVRVWEPRLLDLCEPDEPPLGRVVKLQALLEAMGRERDACSVAAPARRWMEEARRRIAETSDDPESIRRAARSMHVSYETFRKRFRTLEGISPGRYRAERAIETAARRLLTESAPIKQIAAELGFSDEYHFSRRFKQILGVSPGAWRRRAETGTKPPRHESRA